ncbi:MAG: CotH kinase family protein [Myxococcota bacterium]
MKLALSKQWLFATACGGLLACNSDAPATAGDSGGSSSTTAPVGTTEVSPADESSEGESSTGMAPDMGDPGPDPNEDIPPTDEEGCHAIYAQDNLPTFEITIHEALWEQLEWEWNNGQANEDAGVETKPYHSLVEFKYQDVVITDAAIRLRGNPTYWDPLPEDKMQFQIGFHTQDPDGHFLGLKRLALDAATYNRHLLRDRLGLMFMRDAGVRAGCANNARLVVNGEYYGVFTNLEKIDEAYLQRAMEDPSGDLWKRANWQLKTNKDTSNDDRLDDMRDAKTLEELEEFLDIEQALRTYAAEAIIPDSDGSWAGGLNFYMYDDPVRGRFVLLPWDLDNTFERFNDEPDGEYPINPDPYLFEKPTTHGRPFYTMALTDPAYFDFYVDTIDTMVHDSYDPEKMLGWIDMMSNQIEEAVITDPNKPYDNDLYYNKVEELREYVQGRYDYLDEWVVCWQTGGVDDGTGQCVMP